MQNNTKLQKMIDALTFKKSIHISIHFLYDFYKNDISLDINHANTYHSHCFCSYVKSKQEGKTLCMKHKNIMVDKVITGGKTSYNTCYMGVTEIKIPVFFMNQLIAVVFLGGLVIREDFEKRVNLVEKNINKLGLNVTEALSNFNTWEFINKGELYDYIGMAQTIADFITSILNANSSKYESFVLRKKKNENFIIYNIVSHIEKHYDQDLKLDDIAAANYINPQYLSRLFKSTMGINISDYIINTRIEHAKTLLRETTEKNSVIAFQCGFNSVNYFNNSFKKNTGLTPKEYRLKHLGNN